MTAEEFMKKSSGKANAKARAGDNALTAAASATLYQKAFEIQKEEIKAFSAMTPDERDNAIHAGWGLVD